jgi:hypothetical protein
MTENDIVNQALGRIGSAGANNYATDNTPQAKQARLFYASTRDGLLRSHMWGFAKGEASLTASGTAPLFKWGKQYPLPTDCLRVVTVYPTHSHEIQGNMLLTYSNVANIIYIKRITDVSLFDSLFTEVLVLAMASKLCIPLSQDKNLKMQIDQELEGRLSHARLVNLDETSFDRVPPTWLQSRWHWRGE